MTMREKDRCLVTSGVTLEGRGNASIPAPGRHKSSLLGGWQDDISYFSLLSRPHQTIAGNSTRLALNSWKDSLEMSTTTARATSAPSGLPPAGGGGGGSAGGGGSRSRLAAVRSIWPRSRTGLKAASTAAPA